MNDHRVIGSNTARLTIDATAAAPGNDYRIVDSEIEFRIGTSPWRILTSDEIRWHFRLHTEVAAWLEREYKNSWVWS